MELTDKRFIAKDVKELILELKKTYPYNLLDFIGCEEATEAVCYEALGNISDREREIISKYFEQRMTLEEIGKFYGVTRERIRQVMSRGLRRFRVEVLYSIPLRKERQHIYEQEKRLEQWRWRMLKEYRRTGSYDSEMERLFGEEKSYTKRQMVSELGLNPRTENCLKRAGVIYVDELVKMSYPDVRKIRNMGKISADEIVGKLEERGLSLLDD